jgi:lysophospholipase L1-like esterase
MRKELLIIFCMLMGMAAYSQNAVTITNAGHNGDNTVELLARLNKDVIAKKPQVVVLMVGTNDMLNLRNKLTVQEYKMQYQKLITAIKKDSKLFLMTIPPINAEYVLQRIDAKNYAPGGPQARVDSANAVIKELAIKNKCRLIDLNKILLACGGSTSDKESLFQNVSNFNVNDGVHPTANGYKVIGTAVYQAIINTEPKATHILCFGDSITFGFKMTGQGTITGDCYPAVLNRLFNNR